MSNVKFLDELSEFHLHELARLQPGTRVIVGHVPPLTSDPEDSDFEEYSAGHIAEISEVKEIAANTLYKFENTSPWMSKLRSVIFFRNDESLPDSEKDTLKRIYATDAGVIPYDGDDYSGYNDVNFIVILSDLEATGVTPLLKTSPAYDLRLKSFNSRVINEASELKL